MSTEIMVYKRVETFSNSLPKPTVIAYINTLVQLPYFNSKIPPSNTISFPFSSL